MRTSLTPIAAAAMALALAGCAPHRTYTNPEMDFAAIRTVAFAVAIRTGPARAPTPSASAAARRLRLPS